MRVKIAIVLMMTFLTLAVTPTSALASVGSPIETQAEPVSIVNADGRREIFWVAANTHLFHRYEKTPGGAWSADLSLGGEILYDDIDVGMNSDGRLEVFGIGTDRAMWHIWQKSSGGWSQWASLGGGFSGPPTVGYIVGTGALVVSAYGLAPNTNREYAKYQTSPNCCWSTVWQPI